MAFPVVAGTNTSSQITSGTSHPVSLPASIASGDLLVIVFGTGSNGVIATVTTPSGWTALVSQPGSVNTRLVIFYKVADGSEGASVTVTTTTCRSAHNSFRITGHDVPNTTPASESSVVATTATPDPPSLNPAGWGTEDTLWIAFATSNGDAATGWPSTFTTNNLSVGSGGATPAGAASATLSANAASEDPGTFTLPASVESIAETIAIRTKQSTVNTKSLTAALSFSGSIARMPQKPLTGALSFSGSLVKQTARALVAALSFSGSFAASKVFTRALTAALSFSGSLSRRPGKSLAGALSFAGSLTIFGIIADIKGLAVSLLSLVHQALSSNAAVNSAAASDAEPGDATGGSS